MQHPNSLEEYLNLSMEAISYVVLASRGEAQEFFETDNPMTKRYYFDELSDHIRDAEYLLGEMKKMLDEGIRFKDETGT